MLTNKMIDNRVAKIDVLEAQIKELEAQVKALKDELKADMDSKGVNVLNTGKSVLRYTEFSRKLFDQGRFEKEHNDLYAAYLKDSFSKRFTVHAA